MLSRFTSSNKFDKLLYSSVDFWLKIRFVIVWAERKQVILLAVSGSWIRFSPSFFRYKDLYQLPLGEENNDSIRVMIVPGDIVIHYFSGKRHATTC